MLGEPYVRIDFHPDMRPLAKDRARFCWCGERATRLSRLGECSGHFAITFMAEQLPADQVDQRNLEAMRQWVSERVINPNSPPPYIYGLRMPGFIGE